jgi:hypothetical protein
MGIAQYFSVFTNQSLVQGNEVSGTLNGAVGSGSGSLDSAFTFNGLRFTSDATTLQVAVDLTAAMADCSGRENQIELTSNTFDGLVLTPGVYHRNTVMFFSYQKTLTLDADGDPNAVWIFNIDGGVFLVGTVSLINYPGSDVPVWWNVDGQADSSVYIGGGVVIGHIMSTIKIEMFDTISTGSLLSLNSITFNDGRSVTSQARTFPNPYGAVTGE